MKRSNLSYHLIILTAPEALTSNDDLYFNQSFCSGVARLSRPGEGDVTKIWIQITVSLLEQPMTMIEKYER